MHRIDPTDFDNRHAQGRLIPFFEKDPDREDAALTWSCYGDTETNDILVVLATGSRRLIGADRSLLLFPPMRDRLFGIDVDDQALAEAMADRLFAAYQQEQPNA